MRAMVAVGFAAGTMFVADGAFADVEAFRWSRPITIQVGTWVRVILPDDVLAACRAGLPDVRVRADGADVPFVIEEALDGIPTEWPVRDVESLPGRETTAIVDRGERPAPASGLTLEIDASEFLKPLVVEASDDAHAWREIARGSIFATASSRGAVHVTTVRFAPNDRRYFRLRLDDRNGPPVAPRAVLTGVAADPTPPRQVPLTVIRTSSDDGESTYTVDLPSPNLAVSSITLAPTDAAFVRPVTVFERILFRDEITRRAVGGATVTRGPSGESLSISLGELRGPTLELRVDDGASPPLALPRATASLDARSVLFFAPSGTTFTLDYGSPSAAVPKYDLAAALSHGRPSMVSAGQLGDAVDHGESSPVGLPPHGALVDLSAWRTRAAIDLPSGVGVTYLSLDGTDAFDGLRVIDGTSREVPYLYEDTLHHARQTLTPSVAQGGGKTVLTLANLTAFRQIDGIELTATGPDYFRRNVSVVESVNDARGPIAERTLGSGIWERRPGQPAAPFALSVLAPGGATVTVRIDDGDNAALTLGAVSVERSVRRIDFVRASGDSLSLLTGNAAASAPSYDLSLLAAALLAAPADAAQLEPARDIAPPSSGTPKWFWAAIIVAAFAVAAALARTLAAPKKA